MKKYFIRNKIYAGGSDRSGIPLCHHLGKAVYLHASDEIKSPFIMVARGVGAAEEALQIAVGDAICAQGGEVLLVDSVTVPAAALLTKKYRADFSVAVDGEYVEILDNSGCNISRVSEQKIEKIINERGYFFEEAHTKEGEFYCRRDAYLDYSSCLIELAGRRKIRLKVALGCNGGAIQKAAEQVFSILTKNLFFCESTDIKKFIAESGADIGFYFDCSGRSLTVYSAGGEPVSAEDTYCLLAAKMAEKDIIGNTIKDSTGRGVRLQLLENGSIHFGDFLPGTDALFTAVMLSIYLSDKDEPLHKLVEELKCRDDY